MTKTLRERHQNSDEYVIFAVGRKGRDFLKKRGYPVIDEITGLADSPAVSRHQADRLAGRPFLRRGKGGRSCFWCTTNSSTPLPSGRVEKQLLPLADPSSGGSETKTYEYEPSAEEVLDVLLPRYAETLIYSALLEAKASEFGARMAAMGNATDNATEMIES